MSDPLVLLVEENLNDELLTVLALRKANICDRIHVARDGQDALDYLFGNASAGGPQVMLLDLKLPKVSGLRGPWFERMTHTATFLNRDSGSTGH